MIVLKRPRTHPNTLFDGNHIVKLAYVVLQVRQDFFAKIVNSER
jgi:hypothetical protein